MSPDQIKWEQSAEPLVRAPVGAQVASSKPGDPAMGSAKDKVAGKANELAGKAKQAAGDATDNNSLRAKGAAQKAKGGAQQAKGKLKDVVKNAVDKT
jgi:uncharacterized protein YjbJ (UPF0337 family)